MKGKIVSIAGHQFELIRKGDLPLLKCMESEAEQLILLPYYPPDDHLEFPLARQGTDVSGPGPIRFASAGVARHTIHAEDGEEKATSFSATDLVVFIEIDWYGECWQVLEAHGWLDDGGGLSRRIVSLVADAAGHNAIEDAKQQYHENWEAYVAELAALHFATPLSRLWYAANMKSLYYCHQDDLRLGFLWAEYQLRMRLEADAARGQKIVASAKAGAETVRQRSSAATATVICAMGKHLAKGHSIANSARLAFSAGVGTSVEANRKLYSRAHSSALNRFKK